MATDTKPDQLVLPAELLERIDALVAAGETPSRERFVADAVRRALAIVDAAVIDAAFADMAADEAYLAEVDHLDREFDGASWEAWRLGEPAS